MSKKLLEHILSIIVVGSLFIVVIIYLGSQQKQLQIKKNTEIESYLELDFLDFDNPLHKSLLKETLNIFYPSRISANDSLLQAIDKYRSSQLVSISHPNYAASNLSGGKFIKLFDMYLDFIFVYFLVMVLTYYGVQTLAIFRFVKMKQNRRSYLVEAIYFIRKTSFPKKLVLLLEYLGYLFTFLGKAIIKSIMYLVLFAPSYVVAYSFKTRFDTDSFFFMILLGVISNGLLITYSQKFYTFLVAESRRGYVQTAIVKNLNNNYFQRAKDGISYKAIFALLKKFPGHVFQHIYINARYQYLATIKEQASFLITGLIIIEMALNIQGHLCYEMLQNILYQQYDIVLSIILGIFLIVKVTEIFADLWIQIESNRYENRAL